MRKAWLANLVRISAVHSALPQRPTPSAPHNSRLSLGFLSHCGLCALEGMCRAGKLVALRPWGCGQAEEGTGKGVMHLVQDHGAGGGGES